MKPKISWKAIKKNTTLDEFKKKKVTTKKKTTGKKKPKMSRDLVIYSSEYEIDDLDNENDNDSNYNLSRDINYNNDSDISNDLIVNSKIKKKK